MKLGHALPALLRGDQRVTIILGYYRLAQQDRPLWTLHGTIGRLHWGIRVLSMLFTEFYLWNGSRASRAVRIIVSLAGLLSSLWGLDTSIWHTTGLLGVPVRWAAVAALITFLVTIVPLRYPAW